MLGVRDLPRYDVDPVRGFLPVKDPLERLPAAFEPWDELAAALPALLAAGSFREAVERMPLLDPGPLHPDGELRRAMLLLSVFGNAYVWGGESRASRIPARLAVPLCAVAERVGRPPIVAHSSMALSNWRRLDPAGPLELDNLDTLVSFLDLPDERWFFLVTIAIEARGAAAIPALLLTQAAASRRDAASAAAGLGTTAQTIESLNPILLRMYEKCDPPVFFERLRPFLTGWPEPGVVYQGVSETPRCYIGGSAAQSALVQTLDAVLGVRHSSPASGPYLTMVRNYMQPGHRRFLEQLERGPSLPDFVRSRPWGSDPELHRSYEACLDGLDRFRKLHLEMAARYITQQAGGDPGARGTGGTEFGEFLGAARRATQDARTGRA